MENRFRMIVATMLLGAWSMAAGQSPVSAFFNGKGKGVVALSYAWESYDEVFLAPEKIRGVPIFERVNISSVNLYTSYGILDNLDLVATLPYIQVRGSASEEILKDLGFENTREGLQDISVFLKYRPFIIELGSARLDLIGAAGIQTPLGSYAADEGLQYILAIGNRATRLEGMGMAQFRLENGLFAAGQAGYSWRNNQVPNAFVSQVKLGYAGKAIYADAFLAWQRSSDGVDILGPGFEAFFPATRVNFTRLGLNIFAPLTRSFGVSAGAMRYVQGRNLGQSTGFYGGIVYGF
jgi:hypothetical protein